ncbi:hypothetical protein F6S87_07890 [Bifidobacterium sp. BRDM6]|uniref:Uncharacterized protein n=1 Tax=Bifidobacterium choloepi TaxID=2614131 RepID=A0A6I5N9P0_9BIFI|nr:hypothetical protein [Bifidobacterium choloepi]
MHELEPTNHGDAGAAKLSWGATGEATGKVAGEATGKTSGRRSRRRKRKPAVRGRRLRERREKKGSIMGFRRGTSPAVLELLTCIMKLLDPEKDDTPVLKSAVEVVKIA